MSDNKGSLNFGLLDYLKRRVDVGDEEAKKVAFEYISTHESEDQSLLNSFKELLTEKSSSPATTTTTTTTNKADDKTPPSTPTITQASSSSVLKKPKQPLKFSTNGVITPSEKNKKYFYLHPKEQCEQLFDSMMDNQFVLFYGPRSSGKTTTSITVCDLLNNVHGHISMFISLESYSIKSSLDFWNTLIKLIRSQLNKQTPTNKELAEMDINGLLELFRYDNEKSLFYSKTDVHLFIDEFDIIFEGSETISQVLPVFRSWRDPNKRSSIKSLLVIGTFSILDFNNVKYQSPFNISQTIGASNFKKEEVYELFSKFQEQTDVSIEQSVISDIFTITNGHKGIVNLVGEIIQRTKESVISTRVWDRLIDEQFINKLLSYRTVSSMLRSFNNDNSDFIKRVRDLLFKANYTDDFMIIDCDESHYLAGEGILLPIKDSVDNNKDCFTFSSNIIKYLTLRFFKSKSCIVGKVPHLPNKTIDFKQLFIDAANQIDPSVIQMSFEKSFKVCTQNLSQLKKNERVPCELVYSNEMSIILSLLISGYAKADSDYYISPNNNILYNGKTYRPDLVISSKSFGSVILEFVVTTTIGDVKAHIEKTQNYVSNYPDATQGWVIHFTMAQNHSLFYKYPTIPSKYKKVGIIHIYHNKNYSKLKFTVYPPSNK